MFFILAAVIYLIINIIDIHTTNERKALAKKRENERIALAKKIENEQKALVSIEKEIQAYEEYCYKQFKLNLGKGYLNAYGPSVAMDLPFAWREELTEAEKIANDPDYVSANSVCKDVLDRIMKTTIDTNDE